VTKTTPDQNFCSIGEVASCCKVEALVTVDERGQMVLPKEIRERAGIKPGDKMALISWVKDERICCLNLIRADELGDMVKKLLGPMMTEISQG
jgi:antitoxin PrlF